MKCKIPNCRNLTEEGQFIGKLCVPCYEYIIDKKGITSQAYRNEKLKEDILILI